MEVARPGAETATFGEKVGSDDDERDRGDVDSPAFYARYNYYSLHTDTKDHVLWPWHEWEKENRCVANLSFVKRICISLLKTSVRLVSPLKRTCVLVSCLCG